jgi:hypothetical protein
MGELFVIGCDPPTPDGVVIRSPQQSPPLLFSTSSLRIDNIPWNLFKHVVQHRGILPQDMSANQGDSSELPVIPIGEGHFRLLSSSPTDFCSAEIPSAVTNSSHDVLFDQMDLFNPTLHDWTFENDITRSLLLDIAVSRTSLEANQTESITNSSSDMKISHEFAVPFLSELSFLRDIPQVSAVSAVSDLTAFLRRYTVDDSDLELTTFLGTLGKSTHCIALYRISAC